MDDAPEVCVVESNPNGSFDYGPEDFNPITDPNLDNQYGDLVRTGQRLDLMTTLHQPFWVGKTLDVDHGLSLRHTQYSLGVPSDADSGYDSFPSRTYFQYDVTARTFISRVFDWSETLKIKHSMIPRVELRYIPEIYKTQNHFFGDTETTVTETFLTYNVKVSSVFLQPGVL